MSLASPLPPAPPFPPTAAELFTLVGVFVLATVEFLRGCGCVGVGVGVRLVADVGGWVWV